MREQSHPPALEWRAQSWFGDESIDAKFHGRLHRRKLMRKTVRVMEIRLSRRMRQRPI